VSEGEEVPTRPVPDTRNAGARYWAAAANGVLLVPKCEECARTFWHRHENGQILQVLSGRGLICTAGEQPRPIGAGDTVWVPPGERHWHGAAPGSFMSHTAISLGTTRWEEEVADE